MTTTADRVRESATATIGTGNVTLAGAASGFRAFYATFSTGSFYYTIVVGTQWEVGVGHCTDAATLVRDTLLSSSTGSSINFSAGTADVFATAPAGGIPLWTDSTASGMTLPDGSTKNLYASSTIAILGNSLASSGAGIANGGGITRWEASTAYSTNTYVFPVYWNVLSGLADIKWKCTTAGTSGSLEPDWPHASARGATVTDGTVVWTAEDLGENHKYSFGYWTIAQAMSGQRLQEGIICGRYGKQSNDILLYIDRILAETRVGVIFFSGLFENDCWPGAAPTLSTIATRWDAFVIAADKCRKAGRKVMIQTLFPNGSTDSSSLFTGYSFGNGSKAWIWLNNKVREYCATRSDVILFDASQIYCDPNPANPVYPENTITYTSASGSGQQLKKTDGIDPNLAAHWLLGKALAAILTDNFQARNRFSTALDTYNNVVNPLNYGTGGTRDATIASGTVPTSLTMVAYGGTACSSSAVDRTDGILGTWARLVYSASSAGDNANINWSSSQTPCVAVGAAVNAYAEVRILANPTQLIGVWLQLRFVGASNQWSYSAAFTSVMHDLGQFITEDTTLVLKLPPLIVPPSTTSLNSYIKVAFRGVSSGTADFGRVSVLALNQPSTPA